jgi:hypothetical protein
VNIRYIYINCILIKKAYDTINATELVEIMREFGRPMKLVRLVKMTLENTNNKVKIQGKLSPSFETVIGL